MVRGKGTILLSFNLTNLAYGMDGRSGKSLLRQSLQNCTLAFQRRGDTFDLDANAV